MGLFDLELVNKQILNEVNFSKEVTNRIQVIVIKSNNTENVECNIFIKVPNEAKLLFTTAKLDLENRDFSYFPIRLVSRESLLNYSDKLEYFEYKVGMSESINLNNFRNISNINDFVTRNILNTDELRLLSSEVNKNEVDNIFLCFCNNIILSELRYLDIELFRNHKTKYIGVEAFGSHNNVELETGKLEDLVLYRDINMINELGSIEEIKTKSLITSTMYKIAKKNQENNRNVYDVETSINYTNGIMVGSNHHIDYNDILGNFINIDQLSLTNEDINFNSLNTGILYLYFTIASLPMNPILNITKINTIDGDNVILSILISEPSGQLQLIYMDPFSYEFTTVRNERNILDKLLYNIISDTVKNNKNYVGIKINSINTIYLNDFDIDVNILSLNDDYILVNLFNYYDQQLKETLNEDINNLDLTLLNILNEADAKTELRKEIENKIFETYNVLDKTRTNTSRFIQKFANMSDNQFFNYIRKFLKDEDANFDLEIIPNKIEPKLDDILRALKSLGVPKDEYVFFRHDGNKDNPIRTRYKVPVG